MTFFNRRYNEAMEKYEECLSVAPTQSADVFSAMGFTAHLQVCFPPFYHFFFGYLFELCLFSGGERESH